MFGALKNDHPAPVPLRGQEPGELFRHAALAALLVAVSACHGMPGKSTGGSETGRPAAAPTETPDPEEQAPQANQPANQPAKPQANQPAKPANPS